MDLEKVPQQVLEQLDDFISTSLHVYEQEGLMPGINYKNFVIDANGKMWFVDSEPFPKNTHQTFEIAHAREARLTRDFGENAKDKFPKTWEWIEMNKRSDYIREKSLAEKERRNTN